MNISQFATAPNFERVSLAEFVSKNYSRINGLNRSTSDSVSFSKKKSKVKTVFQIAGFLVLLLAGASVALTGTKTGQTFALEQVYKYSPDTKANIEALIKDAQKAGFVDSGKESVTIPDILESYKINPLSLLKEMEAVNKLLPTIQKATKEDAKLSDKDIQLLIAEGLPVIKALSPQVPSYILRKQEEKLEKMDFDNLPPAVKQQLAAPANQSILRELIDGQHGIYGPSKKKLNAMLDKFK